jgi:septal ring factor EnvC (AmiA/AmiB activator)
MRKLLLILSVVCLALPAGSQTRSRQTTQRQRTTKSTAKSRTAAKSTKTTKQQSSRQKQTKTVTYTNASIRGLQSQRAAIQKKIREQEQALKQNKADVAQRLQNLMVVNGQIDQSQKNIEGIQKDIHHIEGNIGILNSQLKTLESQLKDRQAKYIKSMRYLARHRSVQDKLMFIFSAKNFVEMYRRLRFVREYAQYQRAQGEAVRAKQDQVNHKHRQLQTVKGQKNRMLSKGEQEKNKLEGYKTEQQGIVAGLQKQQKTIQSVIAEQHKKDAVLNAQIDRLVEIEVQKVRARAEAEARRKAAAAEAAKRRAAELARKKAAAEAAARENARRIAEAQAREAAAKEAARKAAAAEAAARREREEAAAAAKEKAAQAAAAAERKAQQEAARQLALKAQKAEEEARKAAAQKAAAEQAAREAEAAREAAERKQAADAARSKKEIAEAQQDVQEATKFSTVDRMMNNGFEANRGRLPMPITGSYKIVSHYGQYNVEGLKGVTLDNKGINIMGGNGCQARSVYDGEVSAVFGYAGNMVVMVRHGAYISVYANLRSVNVSRGQKVSTRQILGTVGPEHILQFQLRKERATLNPEAWIGR